MSGGGGAPLAGMRPAKANWPPMCKVRHTINGYGGGRGMSGGAGERRGMSARAMSVWEAIG